MKRTALLTLLASVVVGVATLAPAALGGSRPDDRAGPLGADVSGMVAATTPSTVRPDDRAGPRGAVVETQEAALSPAAAHPDNRPGPRGVIPVAEAAGTDWTAITTGVAAGAAALLVLAGVLYATRHGGHRPHRPVHTQ